MANDMVAGSSSLQGTFISSPRRSKESGKPGGKKARPNARALQNIFHLDQWALTQRAMSGEEGFSKLTEAPSGRGGPRPLRNSPVPRGALKYLAGLPASSRYRKHAAGTLGSAIAAIATREEKRRRGIDRLIEFGKELDLLPAGEEYLNPKLSRSAVAEFAYVSLAAPCVDPDSYSSSSNVFDAYQASTIQASYTVNRPISVFAASTDPRNWDNIASETFVEADEMPKEARPPLILDPTANSPPPGDEQAELEKIGKSWSGLLFENGRVAGNVAVMDFENILAIDYSVTSEIIRLDYALSEGLNLEIDAARTCVGLDRDTGVVKMEKLDANTTKVTASKSVRIAHPPMQRDVLNFGMAVALRFWFKNLVLLGVCDNTGGDDE